MGLGHPYRGDDSIGIRAAEEFESWSQDPAVEVVVAHELLPELTERISHVDLLVFLDARAGGVPGSVEVSEIKPAEIVCGAFLHTLTIKTLLSVTRTLFGHVPQTILISVAGVSFDFALHLSLKVEGALPIVIERLKEVIHSSGRFEKNGHNGFLTSCPSAQFLWNSD